MSRHSAGSGKSKISAAFGSGVVGKVVDRAFENPAASGGLLVMALTASAIAVNATFLQADDHPRPNLAPRAPVHAAAAIPPVPTPRPRETAQVDAASLPPSPAVAAAPPPASIAALSKPSFVGKPAAAPAPAPAAPADAALIADTQRELARLGLYTGTIDGIGGSRTKAAIAAYQTATNTSASGAASPEMLALLKRSSTAAKPVPTVAQAKPALVPPASVPVAASASVQVKPAAATPAGVPVAVPVVPVAAQAPVKPVAVATLPAALPNPAATDAYRRVQLALNQIGYGPIPVDGKAGKETADAIRRFELENGLAVTGVPGDAVVKRLVTIGAIAAR